jgi:hypothetical protein
MRGYERILNYNLELFGAILHQGRYSSCGHYVSIVRHDFKQSTNKEQVKVEMQAEMQVQVQVQEQEQVQEQVQVQDQEQELEQETSTPTKPKRRRPRKTPLSPPRPDIVQKRERGRPRKTPLPTSQPKTVENRGRGRPRKNILQTPKPSSDEEGSQIDQQKKRVTEIQNNGQKGYKNRDDKETANEYQESKEDQNKEWLYIDDEKVSYLSKEKLRNLLNGSPSSNSSNTTYILFYQKKSEELSNGTRS